MNAACPGDGELQRLLADQLPEADEQTLERHVARCEACQRRLEELTDFASEVLSDPAHNDNERPRSGGALARLACAAKPLEPGSEVRAAAKDSQLEPFWRRYGGSTSIVSSGRFLRRQIWTWPLIAAALLGGAGWWVHHSVESAMRQQRINELVTVRDANVAALRGWMDNQRVMAELFAADEQLEPLVQELLMLSDATPEARGRLAASPAQAAIRSRLAKSVPSGGFTGFLLVSPAGVTLAVDDDSPVGVALTDYRKDFFAGVSGGKAAVSKPFLNPLVPAMYAAAPIRDLEGRPIAALGLCIRPDDQFLQILHATRPGHSGETYVFDRSGLLLSESRFDDDLKQMGLLVDRPDSSSMLSVELRDPGVNLMAGKRPKLRRADQQLTRMAGAAVLGSTGFDVEGYRDYRGVPVVGAWRWLDEYDFGIATEIDLDEAFEPVYVLRRDFAVLMGLLTAAAVGIFLAMLVMARQQRQLHNVSRVAQKFGQYTLVDTLGTGGMGTVYKARHALLRRPTAVKLLNPETLSDTAFAPFEREVQLTSGLTHPHTVAIYDYGRTEEGVFYYAMEYLDGVNLDELVRRHGPLPQERVVYLLRQVCGSLGEAHAAGLVHRDVKPANIFLTVRGGQHDFVKVLDFGLAKLVCDHDAQLTSIGTIAGTPHFVSPEAITRPDQIDARADVYAIGAVGYFLLTGSPVFSGSSAADICLKHVSQAPESPAALMQQPLCPSLEALLLRCLAKLPADRPQDAADLLHELNTCTAANGWTASHAALWWAERSHERRAINSIVSLA